MSAESGLNKKRLDTLRHTVLTVRGKKCHLPVIEVTQARPPFIFFKLSLSVFFCNGQPNNDVTTKNVASQEICTQFWRSLA